VSVVRRQCTDEYAFSISIPQTPETRMFGPLTITVQNYGGRRRAFVTPTAYTTTPAKWEGDVPEEIIREWVAFLSGCLLGEEAPDVPDDEHPDLGSTIHHGRVLPLVMRPADDAPGWPAWAPHSCPECANGGRLIAAEPGSCCGPFMVECSICGWGMNPPEQAPDV
jgi:hypothetical protein